MAVAFAAFAAPAPLPRDSVYQAEVKLTDDRGQRISWREQRGSPQVVSMFYTSCKFVCPMLIEGIKAVEHALPEAERTKLHVTLVSLDPARDAPKALAQLRTERRLDPLRWTIAAPDAADVRIVAGLLGVRYRRLADGDFNHTSVLVLLDGEGRVLARTERIGGVAAPAFLAAVRDALRTMPPPP